MLILVGIFLSTLALGISALKNNPYQPQSPVNFLLLGLDPRDDQLEKTNTTDTIIFLSLDLSTAGLTLISLPRDLWFYPLEAKINQIYPKSFDQSDRFTYIQNNFSQIIGQKIDHTFIITSQNLIDFVNLLAGVDVYLKNGFTDTQFPNPEYIKNPSPHIPVYITIDFAPGWNHLDQSNIAFFVRSRYSAPTADQGGTDIGRNQRQQLLIQAILTKLKSPKLAFVNIVNFYNFFHQNIQTNLSDKEIFSLLLALRKDIFNLNVQKITIPTGENIQKDILYYPGRLFYGQWVFLPQDRGYQSLQDFIRQSL